MSEMTMPESRARLGYLLSEILSLPHLPADLNQVISDHLQQQLNLVNILNPEYCLRLYPVLAELADQSAKANGSHPSVEVATPVEEPVAAIAESISSAEVSAPVEEPVAAIAESISDAVEAEVVNDAESISDAVEAEMVNVAESISDAVEVEIVNGAAHEQADDFNLPLAGQDSQDEQSESF